MHFRFGVLIFASLSWSFASAQTFSQQGGKLVGSGAVENTSSTEQGNGLGVNQGTSVALSADGNTALVGAPNDNDETGAVWVFVRTSLTGTWSQQGRKLVASDASGNANLGQAVALSADGNTALVGGPGDNNKAGAAWVFTRADDGTWSQQGNKLVGAGASAAPATTGQGWSVSLSADGNTALVGGEANGGAAGVAWVFSRGTSGAWTQQGSRLLGPGASGISPNAYQGSAVALSGDGNTAAVSSPWADSGVGGVWIFVRNGATWSQQGSQLVSTEMVGGNQVPQMQGASVALSSDGNTLLDGAPGTGDGLVFVRGSSGAWTQQGNALIGDNTQGAVGEGQSVALSADGNTALAGNASVDGGVGTAWAFTRDSNGNWTQFGNALTGTASVYTIWEGVGEGSSVALSGDGSTALLGGPFDNHFLGAAWPFVRSQSSFSWVPGSLTQVAVGADGSVWEIGRASCRERV